MAPLPERNKNSSFTRRLMRWDQQRPLRNLPWKASREPYKIWLSEIILQQTRVAQGLPYFEKFVAAYPDVQALAAAPDDAVMKLWEGLGYYSRCRNLLATARQIAFENEGKFPETYEGLLRLKGVGRYTAAAIASFAFGQAHAVVDGNVFRVLSRCFGIEEPTDTTAGKQVFQALADALIDRRNPGNFNQAIMDLGATLCLPKSPQCGQCPLSEICTARSEGLTDMLPLRSRKLEPRTRFFNYFLLHRQGNVWLQQRLGNDIWKGLYEPFLLETEHPVLSADWDTLPEFSFLQKATAAPGLQHEGRQRLSHQIIVSRCYTLEWPPGIEPPGPGFWVSGNQLSSFAFPRTLRLFFDKLTTFK